ncbi:hypothetical protein DZF97_00690 [Clavibacter nebraskensis]|uniref:Chromosome partition protein Smc n=1 Tax=Clavibacter nebraskensis TaxID=31963 RepID=A0A399QKD1_9MICO|nr:hypothetical protein DZF97_00690 [Clavibacter nebraskensis]
MRLAAYKTNGERQRAIAAQDALVGEELEKFEAILTQSVADVAARTDAHRAAVEALTVEAGALSEELLGGIAPDFEGRWKAYEQRADAAERTADALRRQKDELKARLDDTLASFDEFILRNPSVAPAFG